MSGSCWFAALEELMQERQLRLSRQQRQDRKYPAVTPKPAPCLACWCCACHASHKTGLKQGPHQLCRTAACSHPFNCVVPCCCCVIHPAGTSPLPICQTSKHCQPMPCAHPVSTSTHSPRRPSARLPPTAAAAAVRVPGRRLGCRALCPALVASSATAMALAGPTPR